jgi:hypothetical protein
MPLDKIQKLRRIALGPILRPLAAATFGTVFGLAVVVRVRRILTFLALGLVALLTNAPNLGSRLELCLGDGRWVRKIVIVVVWKGWKGGKEGRIDEGAATRTGWN